MDGAASPKSKGRSRFGVRWIRVSGVVSLIYLWNTQVRHPGDITAEQKVKT